MAKQEIFGGAGYVLVSGDYNGNAVTDLVLHNAVAVTLLLWLSSAGFMESY